VDPGLQTRAIERATRLLRDIVGGDPGPVVEAIAEAHLPRREPLMLREVRVEQVLGLRLPTETVADILERLGMALERTTEGWRVTPPSARFDLVHEVDLIADIGRIHSYDNIPISHANSDAVTRSAPETAFDLDRARFALVDRGYTEVITYSFVSPEVQALVDPETEGLALTNPLSADLSVMRTRLWPGLIQAARYNQARQQERLRFFESGLRFRPGSDGLAQQPVISGLMTGPVCPEQWGQRARDADFFDLKSDVEALLALTGAVERFSFVPGSHPALHPGQTACVECLGAPVGLIGMLHPALTSKLDLGGDVFLFELELDPLATGSMPKFAPISRFPAIRRDIAIVVDQGVSYAELARCIRSAASDLLRDLILFDVYAGENIDSGRKSLAFGLILQASSQTLTDEEVEGTVSRVLARLESDLGARLRD
jgi:phenylalanyl-tRNA synthetase beta chain